MTTATQVQPPATVNTVPLAKANSNLALLVTKGKAQGYLTYEELNELLPDDAIAPDRLDALMQQFDELGIELLDEAEGNKHIVAPAADEPDEAMMAAAEAEIEKMEEVVEPADGASDAAIHLHSRGEGVFEVTLGQPGRSAGRAGVLLAPAATQAARLRLLG